MTTMDEYFDRITEASLDNNSEFITVFSQKDWQLELHEPNYAPVTQMMSTLSIDRNLTRPSQAPDIPTTTFNLVSSSTHSYTAQTPQRHGNNIFQDQTQQGHWNSYQAQTQQGHGNNIYQDQTQQGHWNDMNQQQQMTRQEPGMTMNPAAHLEPEGSRQGRGHRRPRGDRLDLVARDDDHCWVSRK
ncbi:uncharacterized protein LOC121856251 [Homarus americanus]|uniref:uncharacterized protein LOC121856251 n=1 Tax=Homarus americanus TaxID=6706 RepID=UPI001C46202B|nr:uncharacterized protein LOC121856251 [Homarus americanus]